MREIRFHGYSDDLVEVRGINLVDPDGVGDGEFGPGDNKPGVLKVATPDGQGLYVVVQYLGYVSGTWTVGVAPLNGECPMPDWPMEWRFGAEDYEAELEAARQGLGPMPCGSYSAHLTIGAPDDVVVTVVASPLGE